MGLIPPFCVMSHFYPRPPRGGRLVAVVVGSVEMLFLSTPSARRATIERELYVLPPLISIHALREEGDGYGRGLEIEQAEFLSTPSARRATRGKALGRGEPGISIHALREEGDPAFSAFSTLTSSFLSTPSARRATMMLRSSVSAILFLSTPSARRATIQRKQRMANDEISIHALREEGDT